MNRPSAEAAPVTLVVQTRAHADEGGAFARWQARISEAVAQQPGFIEQSVMPPNPPTQMDWVILQRFVSADTAVAWLRSDQRQRLLAEVQHLLVGMDDVHLVRDADAGVVPAPVSVVITTRVRPGQEASFRAWEQRIAIAQARSPGFQGYRFEPPIPGVQDDWLAILRFDSEANLQSWLDAPERAALLRESEAFVEAFRTRVVRTGFEQWFTGKDASSVAPPAWKQNMVVLLMLYPVVFLFGIYVQTPVLMGWAGLPFWAALFIANVASVIVLNWLVPWTGQALGWWLAPRKPGHCAIDLGGAALVICLYAACLYAFFRLS
jgi:antibiotic biosynthesis monooxygenase (ABM) superfamily enzyme